MNTKNVTEELISKQDIRQALLQQRATLSDAKINKASKALIGRTQTNAALNRRLLLAKHILSYAPLNGEIAPQQLTNALSANIYLPKIIDYQNREMAFFSSEQKQVKNRYGINEPIGIGKPIKLEDIDIMLIPLVGFDTKGNRIGMGEGFYDKAITDVTKKPLAIGLAYSFQQQQSIPADVWDAPLDVILTNQEIIDPKNQFTAK